MMDKCIYEYYPTYEEREEIKDNYWEAYSKSDDPYQKAYYLLNGVIWAHYWRAREQIEGYSKARTYLKKIRGKNYYSKYRLDIDHYTRHWLYANGDRHDKSVIDSMKKDHYYEEEENKYLPKGMSCYQGLDQ